MPGPSKYEINYKQVDAKLYVHKVHVDGPRRIKLKKIDNPTMYTYNTGV